MAGSYWHIDRVPAVTEGVATPIRARVGGRDWQLDYDTRGEPYVSDGSAGRIVHVLFKLKLTEGDGARFLIDDYGK